MYSRTEGSGRVAVWQRTQLNTESIPLYSQYGVHSCVIIVCMSTLLRGWTFRVGGQACCKKKGASELWTSSLHSGLVEGRCETMWANIMEARRHYCGQFPSRITLVHGKSSPARSSASRLRLHRMMIEPIKIIEGAS